MCKTQYHLLFDFLSLSLSLSLSFSLTHTHTHTPSPPSEYPTLSQVPLWFRHPSSPPMHRSGHAHHSHPQCIHRCVAGAMGECQARQPQRHVRSNCMDGSLGVNSVPFVRYFVTSGRRRSPPQPCSMPFFLSSFRPSFLPSFLTFASRYFPHTTFNVTTDTTRFYVAWYGPPSRRCA